MHGKADPNDDKGDRHHVPKTTHQPHVDALHEAQTASSTHGGRPRPFDSYFSSLMLEWSVGHGAELKINRPRQVASRRGRPQSTPISRRRATGRLASTSSRLARCAGDYGGTS